MSTVPNRETFESMYAGKAPWDIGKPQPAFVEVADRVTGAVLDAGCGTGENALFFAGRGHSVLGIDFLERPLQEARRKAQERGLNAEFLLLLSQLTEPRPRSAGWKRLGLGVPVVDARLLVTPQDSTDRLGDFPRRRGTLAEQFGEDRPHLRHSHCRGFSPPSARAPGRGTTTPEAPA
jgi:SAM-dependent methyltransferase